MEGDLGWHSCGEGYNNWDLNAVVRLGSGGGGGALAPPYDDPFFALPPSQQDVLLDANVWQQAVDMPAMAQADPATAGLDDDFLTQIFSGAPQPPYPSNEVPPVQGAANPPPALDKADSSRGGGSSSSRPKQTRRNTKKMDVKTIPEADFALADVWSWRMYGQKPIKGLPYPRGYYRCNTNKACPAKKLVDRCITDPSLLIVTCIGEHSHALPSIRNALAGNARHKRDVMVGGPSQAPPQPVFASSAAISPPTQPHTVSTEFDAEEDEDAVAVKALIDNAAMSPENAFLSLKPDDALPAPVHGGGTMSMGAAGRGNDGQLFPQPEELGLVSGGGGGRAPILNEVLDTFFDSADVAAGRWGM